MARLRRSGLSRHIIVSMSLMVIGVIVMMILSSWLLYAVLVEFFPAVPRSRKAGCRPGRSWHGWSG
jgi:hypothetical protein